MAEWLLNLATPGQWIVLWVIAAIIVTAIFLWTWRKDADSIGAAIGAGLLGPPLLFGAALLLLNFIDLMIWLWNS